MTPLCSASLPSISSLSFLNGSRVSSSSSSKSLRTWSCVCSLKIKLHLVIVGETQLVGGLVAEFDECLQVSLDERTDPLAPFPDGLANGRVT